MALIDSGTGKVIREYTIDQLREAAGLVPAFGVAPAVALRMDATTTMFVYSARK